METPRKNSNMLLCGTRKAGEHSAKQTARRARVKRLRWFTFKVYGNRGSRLQQILKQKSPGDWNVLWVFRSSGCGDRI